MNNDATFLNEFLSDDPRELDVLKVALEHGTISAEQAPEVLRRLSLALIAQTSDTYFEGEPFLLRMAVRPDGPGPIRVLVNGHLEVAAGEGRTCMLRHPLLLVPGMLVTTSPRDLILLGHRITPRAAVQWYGDYGGSFGQMYGSAAGTIYAYCTRLFRGLFYVSDGGSAHRTPGAPGELSGGHTAESWNAKYPVGSPVRYWPVLPPLDDFPPIDTTTCSEASALGNGEVVVSIVGKSGGVCLAHIEPRDVEDDAGTKP